MAIKKKTLNHALNNLYPINVLYDGVSIMFHRISDNFPVAVQPNEWVRYQNNGEIANGVMIVEGGRILVVAPTEATLYWSREAVSAGGMTTTDRVTALNDWSGKVNTAVQITHNECNTENCAPGFCTSYHRSNLNGKGLTTGKWWLPSLGELMMIRAHKHQINYALSMINGAMQLRGEWYWSSTEHSAGVAWGLVLGNCYASNISKVHYQFEVRPVSELRP